MLIYIITFQVISEERKEKLMWEIQKIEYFFRTEHYITLTVARKIIDFTDGKKIQKF